MPQRGRKNTVFQWLAGLVKNPYLTAVREGLTLALPLIIAGTLAILINTFPLPAYQEYMTGLFGPEWKLFGDYIHNGTFGVISVIMALNIGHSLAEDHNVKHPLNRVTPSIVATVTFSSLMCTMEPLAGGAFAMRWLSVHGLLLSIVISLLACSIFRFLLRFPVLRVAFYSGSTGASMSQAISAMIPAILTVLLFAGCKAAAKAYGLENPNESIYRMLSLPFQAMGSNHIETAVVYEFVRNALWFLGIHGSNVLEPVMQELYIPGMQANAAAYLAGLPPTVIFTKPFFDCYTSIGGAGSTLGLLIAILLRHRDNGAKNISRISILPSIFNINEILLFGLPVVLNPVFIVPFILVPVLASVISYFACLWGLVPLAIHDVAWNIPVFIDGYLATDSPRGSLLQLFNLVVAIAVYLPFVILDNRLKAQQFNENFKKLADAAVDGGPTDIGPRLLSIPGLIGGMAHNLAADLKMALKRNELYMEFQPQVDSDTGRVYGVESLMRWQHPHIGRIPPSVFIGLAEDTGHIVALGLWGIEESVRLMRVWRDAGLRDVSVAVNVSARQLEDASFPDKVMGILNKHRVPVDCLKLEVTESIALTSHMAENRVLARLHALNIRLAIDDFGMGHSSLTYLKKFPVATLKLDAILTRDVLASRSSCEIILSIAELCRSLNIDLLAEYVEDEAHLLKLRSLGCSNIQGYFYSPPLSAGEAFTFISGTHKAYGASPPPRGGAECGL